MGKKRLRRIRKLRTIIEIRADASYYLNGSIFQSRCRECGAVGEDWTEHLAAVIAEWMK